MQNTAMSAAESRALEIDGPQPVWRTLNEAREQAFTGEIVFDVEPEVYAYLDNGVVYYAERADDASLGQRLLEAGVVDDAQLERGIVRVGGVEHLGRLFDRDPSIDRDAVLVLTELLTQELITDLANREIASVRVCAYRHHPSGVHRWFVDPAEAVGSVDAGELAAQLGHTGRLSAIPVASDEAPDNELRIEWDEPLGVFEESSTSVFADFDIGRIEPMVDVELTESVDLRRSTGEDRPAVASGVVAPEREPVEQTDAGFTDAGFTDAGFTDVEFLPEVEETDETGTPEPTASASIGTEADFVVDDTGTEAAGVDTVATVADADVGEVAPPDGEFQVVWPDGSATEVSEAAVEAERARTPEPPVREDDGGFRFEMPPLTFGTRDDDVLGDEGADEIPDDVADAVRRALAAIETATAESSSVAPMDDAIAAEQDISGIADEVPDADDVHDAPVVEWDSFDDLWGEPPAEPPTMPAEPPAMQAPSAQPLGAPLSGFAPPTPDMAAEAIYRREATAPVAGPESPHTSGAAPAVDEDDGSGDGERTSALKRLIGSLRRKDR